MAKIKERVLEYIKINNLSKQDFCDKTGISYANMVGKSLQSELGGEQIYEILQRFPDLNSDWLLLGRGEMLRSVGQNVGNITHGTAVGVNVNGNDISITNNNPLLPTVEHLCESVRDLTTQNTQLLGELSRLISIVEKKAL